jgi:polygalacturonase
MPLHNYLPFRAPLLLTAVGLFSLAITTLAQSASPLPVPALPTINTNTIINITNSAWGAVSSTTLTNTTAIQKAINAASATNGGAGATVEIPAGTYLSGPLTMMSHVNLQIDTNATLQMLPYAKWSGTTTFINGSGLSDIMISGTGTIDGQGSSGWWTCGCTRPYFINFDSSCHRILIEGVTLQNPPTFHLMLKGNNTDITIQCITINTDSTSPNTDGMDLGSSNVLVQNCYISDGDDNIEIGGSSALVANLTVTNCQFGTGHGVSIGSLTQGCVSNVTVVHCGFTGTDYGIRMKSDYNRGGIVQNLSYYNIGMTNINYAPILIYSYYNLGGNPTTYKITPQLAAVTNAYTVSSTTPIWRNIVISNLTATAAQPGMIWGRTELPATNIILSKLNITASGSYQNFEIYNAKQIQIVDSQFHLSASANTNFWLYNADVTFSNTTASTSPISLYGVTTNSYVNKLAFYNCPATVSYTNTLGTGPLTLADSTLAVSNNFTLFPTTVLNYTLDPNTNRVAVVGNLALGGTINATSGPGFGAGTNTLLTYTGTLSGSLPTLGSTPGGPYTYSLDSSVAGQVNLVVKSTSTSTPTTTSVQPSVNPSTYGTLVTFTATVSPAPTNGESVTFKDGSTTLGTGTLSGGQATYTTTASQLAVVSHSITAVYAGDGAFGASTSSALSQTVDARALTVSGLTISNKVYDGTAAAALNTNGYALNTVIGGDAVTLTTNGYIATFVSSNVANGISVTVTNLSLGGAQAGNYTLTQPAGLTGNITLAGSSILLGASANPVAHLSAVSFTANVTPSTLSGSVLFLTNGVVFNSQTLSGGAATSAATSVLPRGANTITAQYSGNSNYSPSTNTLSEVVTNNPPTANPAAYYRLAGSPLTIVITNLATNWSDLDGDTLVLAGVSTPSTNGGTVTFDSANIYYSDSNSVPDQFGYTISDGQGGTNNGIVTVLMAQQTVSDVTSSNGSVTLDFTGIPGNTYWVVAATNLMPPINWMPLSTNVAGTNGLWQFTDTQATNFLNRFYRTQSSH